MRNLQVSTRKIGGAAGFVNRVREDLSEFFRGADRVPAVQFPAELDPVMTRLRIPRPVAYTTAGFCALIAAGVWLAMPPPLKIDPAMRNWKPACPEVQTTWVPLSPSARPGMGCLPQWIQARDGLAIVNMFSGDSEDFEMMTSFSQVAADGATITSHTYSGWPLTLASSKALFAATLFRQRGSGITLLMLDAETLQAVYRAEFGSVAKKGSIRSTLVICSVLSLPDGSMAVEALRHHLNQARDEFLISRFDPLTREFGPMVSLGSTGATIKAAPNSHQVVASRSTPLQDVLVDLESGKVETAPLVVARQRGLQAQRPPYQRIHPLPPGYLDMGSLDASLVDPPVSLVAETQIPLAQPLWAQGPGSLPLSAQLAPDLLGHRLRLLARTESEDRQGAFTTVNGVHLLLVDASRQVHQTLMPDELRASVQATLRQTQSIGLELRSLSGQRALAVQLVTPPNHPALIRLGLVETPYQSVHWKEWVTIPADCVRGGHVRLWSRIGADSLLVGLFSSSASDPWVMDRGWWARIPYPAEVTQQVPEPWTGGL